MRTKMAGLLARNARFIPLAVTVAMFILAYAFGAYHLEAMRESEVFFNLFRNYPFLLISAIGMTFVIISGGIDLSVSGIVALTSVVVAALLRAGWNPSAVILFVLVMGTLYGAVMGAFITYLKVQPFIATLAGMWIGRGMCFFISDVSIPINDRLFRILGQTRFLIPGLADPETKTGASVSFLVIAAIAVLAAAVYVLHYTRFGRTVYALGGNERSAQLMGLPVMRTKVLVYTISGFCSALAGVTLSISLMSGHGLYAQSFELDVIASVVMGGTPLSGGTGYVLGTLLGVLVNAVIQSIIQFDGRLSSWWTKILIGALTLMFIGVQSYLLVRKARRAPGADAERQVKATRRLPWRRVAVYGAAAAAVIAAVGIGLALRRDRPGSGGTVVVEQTRCEDKPLRREAAEKLLKESNPVVVYERNGGPTCIDELLAIYPDGRIMIDDGTNVLEKRLSAPEVEKVLTEVAELGWFTSELYDTWHTRCDQCYGYVITVSHGGRVKTVKGVDGGTDAPSRYWDAESLIMGAVRNGKEP